MINGFCYGPYRDNEDPDFGVLPTEQELRQDISFISRLTNTIRTYGSTGTLKLIPEICAGVGMDVYQGAWIYKDKNDNDKEIKSLIEIISKNPSTLKGLIVGNEVLLRKDLSEDELIYYIQQVKAKTSIPVSTAEPWSIWLDHPKLAQNVDVIIVHIHPYWENISIKDAANYVVEKWQAVKNAYPDKKVIIGETGWPSAGSTNGNAVPSEANQRQFFFDFNALAIKNEIDYFYFDIFDEKWKERTEAVGSGHKVEGAVGSHWGIYSSNGSIKPLFKNLVPIAAQNGISRPKRDISVIQVNVPLILYSDYDSPQNSFFPTGWMGDLNDIVCNPNCSKSPHNGQTCTQISYSAKGSLGWAGIYWQYPLNNWGEYPGYNISQPKTLTFWAKGEKGGEIAEFKVGGISNKDKPYQDSFGPLSTNPFQLTTQWKEYIIDLTGRDLNMVIGGFCWVTSAAQNPQGCMIYVDDISFE